MIATVNRRYGIKLLTFVSEQFLELLKQNQLDTFDKVWNYQVNWFEEPNERRGGWSGVGKVALINKTSAQVDGTTYAYIKKQQNHGRLTWRNPLNGEPTFKREFDRLAFLAEHQFAAPKVMFYAESKVDGKQSAVLMTAALDEYRDLSDLSLSWWKTASKKQQKNLIKVLATELRRFHDLGLVHRALYPKHIFVKNVGSSPEIALIDLEKARFSWMFWYRAFFDLAALNRHTACCRRTQCLAFFKTYLKQEKLTYKSKLLARMIIKRAQR